MLRLALPSAESLNDISACRSEQGSVTIPMSFRTPLFVAFLALALLSLTGVVLRGVSTGDARALGLPAGLIWTVGWSVATFFALVAYDATRPDDSEGEA